MVCVDVWDAVLHAETGESVVITPSTKEGECSLVARVSLVMCWGIMSVFQLVWVLVGSIWVYHSINRAKHECPARLYDYTFAVAAAHWVWYAMLIALSLIAMFAGGGSVTVRTQDLPDSNASAEKNL